MALIPRLLVYCAGSEQEVQQPDRQMGGSSRAVSVTAAQPIADSLENGAAPADRSMSHLTCTGNLLLSAAM